MHHMGVMLEDGYLHHAAVKKNVSRGGNFVCNVLTNILNILTPAVLYASHDVVPNPLGRGYLQADRQVSESLRFSH